MNIRAEIIDKRRNAEKPNGATDKTGDEERHQRQAADPARNGRDFKGQKADGRGQHNPNAPIIVKDHKTVKRGLTIIKGDNRLADSLPKHIANGIAQKRPEN